MSLKLHTTVWATGTVTYGDSETSIHILFSGGEMKQLIYDVTGKKMGKIITLLVMTSQLIDFYCDHGSDVLQIRTK